MTALLLLYALFTALEPYESTRENCLDRGGQWTPEGCWLWEGDFYVLVEAALEAEVAEPAVEAEEPEPAPKANPPSKTKAGYSGVSKADNSLGSSVQPETPRSNPDLRPCFEPCDEDDGPHGSVERFQAGCYGGKWYCPYTCGHASFNEWIADRRSPFGWRD